MKFFEIPVFFLLIALNLGFLGEFYSHYEGSREKRQRIERKLNRDEMVFSTFEKFCSEKKSDFEMAEWILTARKLWKLDDISVSSICTEENKEVFRCRWSSGNESCFAFAKRSLE